MGMPAALVGSSLISGVMGAQGAQSAADAATQSAAQSAAVQQQMFNTINQQQAPYRQAGYTALGQIGAGTAPGGQFVTPFTAQDLNSYLAPNYQWQLQQGLGALNNEQNLTGGINSGNTLAAINNWAQNYAGNAYQNAFNNYQAQQGNIFNRLSAIAGLGQTANQIGAQAGTQIAGNIGNALMGAGQAQAAGQIGTYNALGSGLNNAATWYAMPSILQQMR